MILDIDRDEVLARARTAFEALRGARLLLTGGTGFFGRWLLGSLLHADRQLGLGLEVVVLSRDPDAFLARWPVASGSLRFVKGDVRGLEAHPDPALQRPFTHVIHAATATDARLYRDAPGAMFATIVDGTRDVLAVTARSPGARLLFTSSGAVYGRQPSDLTHVPETYLGAPDPLDPASTYGVAKRAAEHLCILAPTPAVIARCWAFAGPHLPLDAHFAIGNFIRDARSGGPVHVGGDGTPFRSYLYAGDLAVWLWRLLVEGRPGRAYNVGSDRDLSIRELAETVARHYGVAFEVAGQPDPGAPIPRYVPSITRAKEELGLDAWTSLEDSIERTERWLRATERA